MGFLQIHFDVKNMCRRFICVLIADSTLSQPLFYTWPSQWPGFWIDARTNKYDNLKINKSQHLATSTANKGCDRKPQIWIEYQFIKEGNVLFWNRTAHLLEIKTINLKFWQASRANMKFWRESHRQWQVNFIILRLLLGKYDSPLMIFLYFCLAFLYCKVLLS